MVRARGECSLDRHGKEALVSEKDIALDRTARNVVRDLHVRLQIVHAGVVVSALALHQQNADRDEEIARVLEYCVAGVLAEQIDRTAELLASLQPLPTDPDALDSWDPRPRDVAR
jgi:hypothetical protein